MALGGGIVEPLSPTVSPDNFAIRGTIEDHCSTNNMNSIDQTFATLRASARKAFIPFLPAGDPDLDFTSAAIQAVAAAGASLCEVGIPYSDPIADGPVIQASYSRALTAGVSLRDIMNMLQRTTSRVSIPLVTMVSHAVVFRRGVARYFDEAAEAGVAGAIVPDLPTEEADEVVACCQKNGLSLCQLVTPTTDDARTRQILRTSSGFVYCVSVTGITGERQQLPEDLVTRVAYLKSQTTLPICVGFGISDPQQARSVAAVADGIIVGSAFVRRIAANLPSPRHALLDEISRLTSEMVEALADA